jgi:hypothetical protein
MDVEQSISIEYYYPIAKARTVNIFTDGPTGGPADDQPSSDEYGDVY